MAFHWSLSDSKFPRVFRAILSNLTDLNNIVVWMVSALPLIYKSSSPFDNPSVMVPRAPTIIGINVTFMFHSFFQFACKVQVLFFFHFLSILLCGQPGQFSSMVRKTGVHSQVESYQRLKKWYLMSPCKVKKPKEWSSTLPYTSVC